MNLDKSLPVFSNTQIKALEDASAAQSDEGLSQLMEKAGAALYQALQIHFPSADHYHIVCGKGNNGGDGFVVARLALEAGKKVTVYLDNEPTARDARASFEKLQQITVKFSQTSAFNPESGVIVDCLLGTGLVNAPSEACSTIIQQINTSQLPVVSADIPSGLRCDTGDTPGAVVNAQLTVTFIGLKPGLLTGAGKNVCGKVVMESLDIDNSSVRTNIYQMTPELFEGSLPRRPVESHKGMFGHVLVVGGDAGFGGAAFLAASAALRSGAGLVSVVTHPAHASSFLSGQPELMVNGLATAEDNQTLLQTLVDQCDVVVLGPGLGKREFGQSFFNHVIEQISATKKPAVLDADALNWLSTTTLQVPSAVLTPHPGEAARLLSTSTQVVSKNRFAAVLEIQERYKATTLLKGAGSLITDGAVTLINSTGNPGMASGGMGDVLSGLTGALLAQKLDALEALAYGVFVHGLAADIAAQRNGQVGLLASDLLPEIRQVLNSQ